MVILKRTDALLYEDILLKVEKAHLSFKQNLEFADYGSTLVEYESPFSLLGPSILMRAEYDMRQSMRYCRYVDDADRAVVYMKAPYAAVREFSRTIELMHAAIGSFSTSAKEMRKRVGAESKEVKEDGEHRAAEVNLLKEVYRSSIKDAELGREHIGELTSPSPFNFWLI